MSTIFTGTIVAIGERLREERKRLRMTQVEFAEAGSIGVSTLKLYENGDRDPGATFMAELAENGVDVQYVVTGMRSGAPSAADEQMLLDAYRSLDSEMKRRILAFVLTENGPSAVSKKIKEKSGTGEKSNVVIAAGIGTQAAGRKIVNKDG